MSKITFDQLIEKIPNKYELTIVVGIRSRQIGSHHVVNSKAGLKDSTIQRCFKEIIQGKLIPGDLEVMEREAALKAELEIEIL
ncbi:MAG: DNA-directed RNA polymerase subunit omega [Fusobacteriaceae bacterium]